jgi:hypothetical protein
LLALGIFAILAGSLLKLIAAKNRTEGEASRDLGALFLYCAALGLVLLMTFVMEYTFNSVMHSATFYRVVASTAPGLLVGLGRASRHRFGATAIALGYSAVLLTLLWILPLFPAVPRLGPVYYPVTHFVPAGFPLLLVVPALAFDLLTPALDRWQVAWWADAAICGAVFLVAFWAVQWPFGTFLISPASETWFFGTGYHDYNTHPSWATLHHVFLPLEANRQQFAMESALALVAATASAAIGVRLGVRLQRVRR